LIRAIGSSLRKSRSRSIPAGYLSVFPSLWGSFARHCSAFSGLPQAS
jgi:hypothetical protein